MHHMAPPFFFSLCAKFRTNGKNTIENGIFFPHILLLFGEKTSSNFEKKIHHIPTWILDRRGHFIFFNQLFYIGSRGFFSILCYPELGELGAFLYLN